MASAKRFESSACSDVCASTGVCSAAPTCAGASVRADTPARNMAASAVVRVPDRLMEDAKKCMRLSANLKRTAMMVRWTPHRPRSHSGAVRNLCLSGSPLRKPPMLPPATVLATAILKPLATTYQKSPCFLSLRLTRAADRGPKKTRPRVALVSDPALRTHRPDGHRMIVDEVEIGGEVRHPLIWQGLGCGHHQHQREEEPHASGCERGLRARRFNL